MEHVQTMRSPRHTAIDLSSRDHFYVEKKKLEEWKDRNQTQQKNERSDGSASVLCYFISRFRTEKIIVNSFFFFFFEQFSASPKKIE